MISFTLKSSLVPVEMSSVPIGCEAGEPCGRFVQVSGDVENYIASYSSLTPDILSFAL